MEWYIFALASAFFASIYSASIKKFAKKVDLELLACGVFLSGAVVLFFASLIKGIPPLGSEFYKAVIASGIFGVLATILYFRSLKLTDLSLAMPMLSFTPVFLIFTSFFLLGEYPTIYGIIGILLVAVGAYILNTTRNDHNPLDPIRHIFKHKGILYMLIVAFIFSLTTNFDKMAILNSDPLFAAAMIFLFIGVSFTLLSFLTRKNRKKKINGNLHRFVITGVLLAITAALVNIALSMQIVPYVNAIKRVSILFVVLYGCLLFREKHFLKRFIGAGVMVGGAAIIILSG